jgi:hypothetical protein
MLVRVGKYGMGEGCEGGVYSVDGRDHALDAGRRGAV